MRQNKLLFSPLNLFKRAIQGSIILPLLLSFFLPVIRPLHVSADPTITEYPIPTGQRANSLTVGPDDALWFIVSRSDEVGRISTNGSVTEYSLPQGFTGQFIASGPSGELWVVMSNNTTPQTVVALMTTGGSITAEYTLPPSNGTFIVGVTSSSDGTLYFTLNSGYGGYGGVGIVTAQGAITENPILGSTSEVYSRPSVGPDKNIWFTDEGNNLIGRLHTSYPETYTYYPVPTPKAYLTQITAGSDGAMWFLETQANKIGRVTTGGAVTEHQLSTPHATTGDITGGPDGALWFTEIDNNQIGRMTTSGVVTEYPLPNPSSGPSTIISGPDGALWFTQTGLSDIGRITVPPPVPEAPTYLTSTSPTQNPVLTWSSVSEAASYNIYRDGVNVSSSSTPSYTDGLATEGAHSYYVTAVNSAGESPPSNTVNVLIDRTAPNITYTQSPAPNDSGWNNTNVTVAYDCNDESSGIQSCSNSTTLSSEGSAQSATGTATDNAGNTSSVTTDNINIDKTAPTVSGVMLSSYNITYGSHNSVAVAASAGDSLSGVIGGEYYVDTDPGHGNGTALDYANNQLLGDADFSSLGTGTHTVYVRAQDAAGNWSDPTSTSLTVSYPVPVAPTNLTAVTPSNQKLALSWMAGFDPTTPPAISYNIYRNGALIGTSTTTNFTDNNLSSDGTYTYYVTGVNQYGIESTPSNTVTAVYDTNAPTVIYTVTPAANASGWNNSNVTVAFTCSDELSGIQTCPSSHTFSSDGANQSVTATATDNAGNSKVVTVGSINIDKTPPTVSSVHMSSTVVFSLLPVTITADTADNLSGIVKGEYYIDTDPGQGQATAMTYSNGKLSTSATINLGLGLGTHTLYVRSQDTAGNWSLPVSVSFTYIL